jgi:hypothetical protein
VVSGKRRFGISRGRGASWGKSVGELGSRD